MLRSLVLTRSLTTLPDLASLAALAALATLTLTSHGGWHRCLDICTGSIGGCRYCVLLLL